MAPFDGGIQKRAQQADSKEARPNLTFRNQARRRPNLVRILLIEAVGKKKSSHLMDTAFSADVKLRSFQANLILV